MKTNIYFLSYLAPFFLRTRNVSEKKSCRENQNTHFVSSYFFFSFENRTVYEIMWENIVERGRPQMTIWRMRIACLISRATNTRRVILIGFQYNSGCIIEPQYYVIRQLPVLFTLFACITFVCRSTYRLPLWNVTKPPAVDPVLVSTDHRP